MGIGKTLKIMFTNKVKCDNCGSVIIDGTISKSPEYDSRGRVRNSNPGMEGVGLLDTIIYGAKKKVLCNRCKTIERVKKNTEKEMNEFMNRPDVKKQIALEKENLELERENLELNNRYLKQQLNRSAPATKKLQSNSNGKTNFCSQCGNALKPNGRFCPGCGQSVN
ncbi:MAG: hypothetical protein LBI28_12530 [Treponema sp.]|jgi:ribosomal protein L32|nr:hypothetical protein [Treponema sp.]